MRIAVTRLRGFKYAFHGIDVVEYLPGEHDVPQSVADLAIREGWAVAVAAAAEAPVAPAAVEVQSAPAAAEAPAAPGAQVASRGRRGGRRGA